MSWQITNSNPAEGLSQSDDPRVQDGPPGPTDSIYVDSAMYGSARDLEGSMYALNVQGNPLAPEARVFYQEAESFSPDSRIFYPEAQAFSPDSYIFYPEAQAFSPDSRVFYPEAQAFQLESNVFYQEAPFLHEQGYPPYPNTELAQGPILAQPAMYLRSAMYVQSSMYSGQTFAAEGAGIQRTTIYSPKLIESKGLKTKPGQSDHDESWPIGRPLRIAHLNAALIPAGIEYWLASLARYSNPARLQFLRSVVVTNWVDPRQISRMGMPVEIGGRESVMRAAKDCDIMLISDPGPRSHEVCQWLKESPPPISIFIAHGDADYTRDRLSKVGEAVDHIIAVTEHVREEVCEGWPVSVVLNGVDPHRLVRTQPRSVSREALGFSDDDFVVGFVGRFSEEKNPDLVLSALARLPRQCKALLIGYGPMRDSLLEQAMKRLPGRFVITEGNGDLGDYYASMDTFVMPSRFEGYGLVAMEAMMAGVPVIGTPYGMVADLITDGVNGAVVAPDAGEIAAAIEKLRSFPTYRNAIIQGGIELAEKYGYASEMARGYEDLLSKLWLKRKAASDANR
ncbi:glycosyltransferase family 4 protein [Stieleria sp. JC731]|uniref:glycosyltransferase family 4 protein n=1 Tax=Pirellulaceae TaxID=2691357 RepID=UPI001E3A4EFE|nr:glycosyltransferase family 4 protein [Stieleria sp. JC731]MCC9602336.1 glycosyltransferase family 4 protein [Stieleria sp. JC731]